MKRDTFTKASLGLIALALAVIAAQGMFNHSTPVQAASTITPFEYKFIYRTYVPDPQKGEVTPSTTWIEDGKQALDDDIKAGGLGARIQSLGAQGWELVTDVVVSEHMRVLPDKNLATNGVTSSEHLVFKRRK